MTLRKAFDGEVFYWYEDDPAARRAMSTVDPLRFVNAKIYTQADLDHARKEARTAAFKNAAKWAKKVETVKRNAASDAAADDEFAAMRLVHEADGAKRVIETLEAAANTEEGEGMADLEDFQTCDMCGRTSAIWIKFCTLCGLDYCDRCQMTHDAQHEFVAEAMGTEDK